MSYLSFFVPICPFLQPIYFPREGTSALERINWFTQCDGVCKSDAGVFHVLYQGIGKDVKIPFQLTSSFRAYKQLLYTEVSHSHTVY